MQTVFSLHLIDVSLETILTSTLQGHIYCTNTYHDEAPALNFFFLYSEPAGHKNEMVLVLFVCQAAGYT